MKTRIDVSPEMLAFTGDGALPPGKTPADTVRFSFQLARGRVAFESLPAGDAAAELVFLVARAACRRIFGGVPAAPAAWHLPAELRGMALAITQCAVPGEAGATLRLAKSIELLCAVFETWGNDHLLPADGDGRLSAADAARIAAARRLIDERWREKLTLGGIARSCGVNRATLTRGFRAAFHMSVADAIAERRLGGARELLLATDLPVSAIGYRCGYLNNASFSRAFTRRYGQPPTHVRAHSLAA